MTIIIAIVFDTGIVMAADSQTTIGTFKRCDTNKLNPIQFKNGCALIGEAGSAELSGRSVQQMEIESKDAEIKSERIVPDMAQAAIRITREELRRQHCNCSAEELNRIILSFDDCDWLVGYFFDLKPRLFKLCMSTGVDFPVKSNFAAIGSGRELAEYLLGRIVWDNMNVLEAELAAVFVIEQVKKHNAYCSGQTNVAFVSPENVMPDPPERVIWAAQVADKTDEILRATSSDIIKLSFAKTFQDFIKTFAMMNRYIKKHPESSKMTINQVARKVSEESKGKKDKKEILKQMDAFPPFLMRFFAKK